MTRHAVCRETSMCRSPRHIAPRPMAVVVGGAAPERHTCTSRLTNATDFSITANCCSHDACSKDIFNLSFTFLKFLPENYMGKGETLFSVRGGASASTASPLFLICVGRLGGRQGTVLETGAWDS